ncbi:MAG: hypothetical protein HeimC3_19100 [Candidatus Heimdallarchaeota archaeon LC_3]|nr:MAG: hypothetical protein HeimC3_19100 [Candidatus Heimdallarchaeota archaeon LC_3]
MSETPFNSQMQSMYNYVNDSPKLAGTFFSVLNYLALSSFDGKNLISQKELQDRFSYRKTELNQILNRAMQIGLIENVDNSFRINKQQSIDLSKSLHRLFKVIKTNNQNQISNDSSSVDPISILFKCREALYYHEHASS